MSPEWVSGIVQDCKKFFFRMPPRDLPQGWIVLDGMACRWRRAGI